MEYIDVRHLLREALFHRAGGRSHAPDRVVVQVGRGNLVRPLEGGIPQRPFARRSQSIAYMPQLIFSMACRDFDATH